MRAAGAERARCGKASSRQSEHRNLAARKFRDRNHPIVSSRRKEFAVCAASRR
jgi:hypothetical protein